MNRRDFMGHVGKGIAVAAAMPTVRVLGANDLIRIGLKRY
jgi:hypothetical protein